MKASVIIPAYNAADTIEDTLKALKEQAARGYEVIVVDDGSTDETREIAKRYQVKLLQQEHRGPAAARNLGAKNARGDILVFTDADCIPAREWLAEMLRPFDDPSIVGVQGRYETRQGDLIARFAQLEIEERYRRMSKFRYIDFIGSYSAAYRRRVFLESGGFDEGFPIASGEDPDLSFRLSKRGYRMVFNPRAVVYHHHPATLRDYLKKKFDRACWRVALYKRHAGKAIKDTYTPQLLKVQIGLFYLLILSMFVALYSLNFLLPLAAFLFLLGTTLPASISNFMRDREVGLATPAIILMRTAVFGAGLIYGFFRTS
jgi:cellulose synthase/poly-beta-1,6-N-acetylglucosamine synthase-like glycosyltransferase